LLVPGVMLTLRHGQVLTYDPAADMARAETADVHRLLRRRSGPPTPTLAQGKQAKP
jgi:hypothetical protein